MRAAVLDDLDWSEDAQATIIGLAHAQSTLTADDLARELRKPPHPNMVGAAFRAALTAGHISPVGYQVSTTPTRRHGLVRVWARRVQP